MKKLVMTLAAGLFATALMAEVASKNIVGYQTINASGTYPSYGATFISVGNTNGLWHLRDITADGMDPDSDYIQFLNPTDLSLTLAATYCDAAMAATLGNPALQGWTAPGDVGGDKLDDTAFAAGTGFLSSLSGNPVTFTFTGEVNQGTTELDLTGLFYPLVANPVPAGLTLGDITADGMDPDSDYIQFLDSNDLSLTLAATYCDAALAATLGNPALQGWTAPGDVGGDKLDDTVIPAGSAFLFSLSGNPVTMVFPSPMP